MGHGHPAHLQRASRPSPRHSCHSQGRRWEGAAFSPEGGAGHDASQSRCWCSPRGTALQGPTIRNPPLHQKPEKELGAPPQEGGLGVYLTFGPSPRKSSSLKADGTNEQFAATSERARGRSARNVLTVRRHLSRVPVLEATAVLGPAPGPQAAVCATSRPWQRGGRRGRSRVPARPRHKPQADAVAVFFGFLTLGSECSFLDISVSPWGREDGSLFINGYFGADLA